MTSGSPPKVKRRIEPIPDLPISISGLSHVQKLIEENNREVKPKYRLKLTDFINHAFITIGLEAITDASKVQVILDFAEELVEKHRIMPINTSVSKVLHTWGGSGLIQESISLILTLLKGRENVSSEVLRKCFEERTVTVALRICVKSSEDRAKELIQTLMDLIPPEKFKRRLFRPLLEQAMVQKDTCAALQVLALSQKRGIELWDGDYNCLLRTISMAQEEGKLEAVALTEQVLGVMEQHHPVVGAENAKMLANLLGGTRCSISSTGECERCQCPLKSFELTESQREALMNDLIEKLIKPKIEGHCEKQKVSDEELQSRWAIFEGFSKEMAAADYDTLIDGANVGYYGLNNWYKGAKDELLRASGVNPETMDMRIRTEVPFPVDVSPKFSIIEDMRRRALLLRRKPVVVLHQRHLERATGNNKEILLRWINEKAILSSPPFLNDDFCWLYGALRKPGVSIISNDQMRDHHFLLLSPRFFVRWRQRHRITFKAMFHEATSSVVLDLKTPKPYSTWIQRAAVRAAASIGNTVGHHWHIPCMDAVPIIDQGSNRVIPRKSDVELSKDGDDECSSWLCTL